MHELNIVRNIKSEQNTILSKRLTVTHMIKGGDFKYCKRNNNATSKFPSKSRNIAHKQPPLSATPRFAHEV